MARTPTSKGSLIARRSRGLSASPFNAVRFSDTISPAPSINRPAPSSTRPSISVPTDTAWSSSIGITAAPIASPSTLDSGISTNRPSEKPTISATISLFGASLMTQRPPTAPVHPAASILRPIILTTLPATVGLSVSAEISAAPKRWARRSSRAVIIDEAASISHLLWLRRWLGQFQPQRLANRHDQSSLYAGIDNGVCHLQAATARHEVIIHRCRP